MIRADLIVEGAAEVVTCAGPEPWSVSGSARQGSIAAIADGAVASAGERIVFVGTSQACAREVLLDPGGRRLDARGCVVLPGFVDPHTHLPFGGWRDAEFEQRLAGQSYAEIAAAGGGILSTVMATRAMNPAGLANLIHERLDAMLLAGTTTVEAKSGYGLSADSELGILRALASVGDHPVEIVPTLLAAHVVAPEFRPDRRAEYVRLIVEEMIPAAAREGLARFCDVFIDEGAFTLDEAREIFLAAKACGLGLRAHAEQLTHTGAAALAAGMNAFSVDHLERLTEEDVASLATTWSPVHSDRQTPRSLSSGSIAGARVGPTPHPSLGPSRLATGGADIGSTRNEQEPRGTVAILLPGATHTLRETARPPARALIAAGVPVALATDFNPGTSPCLAMTPILNLACVLFGMTPDEAILAATRNAALSLGIGDRVGTLEPGKQADLVLWRVPSRRHLAYRFGPIPCAAVVKRGRIVVESGRLAAAGRVGPPGRESMLMDLEVRRFLEKLASAEPTPGGGSASALAGAQAAALLEMVIALTLKNEKYAASRPVLEPMQGRAAAFRTDLEVLVDRDAEAYDAVVAANRMPKGTDEEKAARKAAREKAFLFAAEIPLKTAELACATAALAESALPHANPNAGSDLLVAGLLADAAVAGAAANVRINLGSITSETFTTRARERLDAWTSQTAASLAAIRARFA